MKDNYYNVSFSADYSLLKYIIYKYRNELPYNGNMINFFNSINYTLNCSHNWSRYGVPVKVWNILHKDLVIAFLSKKTKKFKSLKDLKNEFHLNFPTGKDANEFFAQMHYRKFEDTKIHKKEPKKDIVQLSFF